MTPPRGDNEAEWLTRKKRIDPRLTSRGWVLPKNGTRPIRTPFRSEEEDTDHGPADYALWLDDRIVGLVEAKKLTVGPQNVLTQAERYARGLRNSSYDFSGLRAPFLYSTNGEVIWFHDVRNPLNRSRRVADFHTPNGLKELLTRDFDGACAALAATPNLNTRLHYYQKDAIAAVEKAIAERKRQMLVAMATGTGKTLTSVNLIYRLMKAGLAKRVLFLVDRRALAAQTVRAFASFEAEPGKKFSKLYEVYSNKFQKEDFDEGEKFDPEIMPNSYLTDPGPGEAFVYVSTIQRMAINVLGRGAVFGGTEEGADEDADKLDIPIHAFDLIIADECHRGYTSAEVSTWRNTLDHFDAIKIGLTATPASHTTAYFTNIIFRYEYQQAVKDGHLVDYDAVNIRSNVRVNGVFLKEGEQVEKVNPTSGTKQLDLLEDERHFDTSEIEAKITAPDSNRKIIEEVKRYALEHEQKYGRFPKTLIFAVNDVAHTSHANQLVEICRESFGRGDSFVQKITGSKDVDRPLQRIREFRNRPQPGVVVTVDMLSTGVDIPDLEFIVFLRFVKSRILFVQMLGRGTRKGERYKDKSHFTVFDCFDGSLLAYFRDSTEMDAEPPTKPTRPIKEIISDIWDNRDREYNVGCLLKRLQRIDKEMSAQARDEFAAFVLDGDLAKYARELPKALASNFSETMKLLRSEPFQDLLVNYPRPERVFYVAGGVEDEVSSQFMVRENGVEYKAEDYLSIFNRFVTENPEHIEAIRILLNRPREWNTAALSELRTKLSQAKPRFTIERLQKAHSVQYHRALTDLISMVKHAADEQQPLLTAQERVDRAFKKLTQGQSFTTDQQRWLDRIKAHLVENLSIDREDFDDLPIFSREGGLPAVRRVFGQRLDSLLRELNEGIAA